jgi:hypothetical protein
MIKIDVYDGRQDEPGRALALDVYRTTTVEEAVAFVTQSAWDGDDDELYATGYFLKNDCGHLMAIGRFIFPDIMELDAEPVLEWTFMDGRPAVARRKAEVYADLEKRTAPEVATSEAA